jgi:Dihydrodipicolinate synthase/N-acetylneuraminate lyase
MLKNPNVIGVKNSSMPVQDIQMFKDVKGDDSVVFNGPDEQFISGRLIGADGGIGGTYAVMPELFLAADAALKAGNIARAKEIQYKIDRIIYAMCSCHGNLYAVMKEILKMNELNIGGVRKPLASIIPEDMPQIEKCREMISTAIARL